MEFTAEEIASLKALAKERIQMGSTKNRSDAVFGRGYRLLDDAKRAGREGLYWVASLDLRQFAFECGVALSAKLIPVDCGSPRTDRYDDSWKFCGVPAWVHRDIEGVTANLYSLGAELFGSTGDLTEILKDLR